MVTLRPLTEANRDELLALRVAPGQEGFVSTVEASLREADEHPGARAIQRGIYHGDTPVGFAMFCDEVHGDPYTPQYLWKLLIDARHQRQGHGTAALDLLVERFRGRDSITTSAGPGEGSPIGFYERYGFERTGEIEDGEVVLRLQIVSSQDAGSSPGGS